MGSLCSVCYTDQAEYRTIPKPFEPTTIPKPLPLPLPLSPCESIAKTLSECTEFQLNEILRDVIDDNGGSMKDMNAKSILGDEKDEILEFRIDTMLKDITKQDANGAILDAEEEKTHDMIDKRIKSNSSWTEIADWTEINDEESLTPSVYHKKQTKISKSETFKNMRDTAQTQMAKLLQSKSKNQLNFECNKECPGKLKYEIFAKCECLKRIRIILSIYQTYINCEELWRKASFASIILHNKQIYGIQQLLDDFLHIKYFHIDADHDILHKNIHDSQYQNIAKFICDQLEAECKCNIEQCPVYRRHYRARTNDDKEKQLYFNFINKDKRPTPHKYEFNNKDVIFLQQCDMIHTYFLHSTVKYGRNENQMDVISEETIDKNMQYVERKHVPYLGKKEDELWWKYVRVEEESKEKPQTDRDIYRLLIKNMRVFRYQSSHGFRPGQNQGISQLHPMFANIKEEALHNQYYPISKDNWNQTLRKSNVFCQSWARSKIRTKYIGSFDDQITKQKSDWIEGIEIKLQEIVILKLYTDYDKLQFALKKCFRFDSITDVMDENVADAEALTMRRVMSVSYEEEIKGNRQDLEKRLKTFYHWSVGLKLVLNKFGTKLNGTNHVSLYHGVNSKMLINTAVTYSFYGPLSTSASYLVARTFSTEKGMVLSIGSQFPRLNYCNAFDASLISDYPEEQEWLIGFMYVRLLQVTAKKLNSNINQMPMASYIRTEFFVIHLFRQQIFSMNDDLAIMLAQFLKCNQMECCINKRHENDKELQNENDFQSYKLKYLCCQVAKHQNGNGQNVNSQLLFNSAYRQKYANDIQKALRIINIIWDKFNEFRKFPNLKQCIKFDNIANILKRFFMAQENTHTGNGENNWIISFDRIITVFPNVQEINFLNEYKFDNNVLSNLIKQINKKNNSNKLKIIKFLYYNYNKTNKYNQPNDSKIFINPDNLNKELLNKLNQLNWTIKHNNNGKTGYKIRVFKSS